MGCRGVLRWHNLSHVLIRYCTGFSLEYTGLGTSETSFDSDLGVTTAEPYDDSAPSTTSVPLSAPVTVDLVTDQPTSTTAVPVVASVPQASTPLFKNDTLRVGVGDLEFKLSNVSGVLRKVASFANVSTTNVTHQFGQLFDNVNVTALQEQFEAFKAYVASSVTMQILLICCTVSLFVGCGMMSLVVRYHVFLHTDLLMLKD